MKAFFFFLSQALFPLNIVMVLHQVDKVDAIRWVLSLHRGSVIWQTSVRVLINPKTQVCCFFSLLEDLVITMPPNTFHCFRNVSQYFESSRLFLTPARNMCLREKIHGSRCNFFFPVLNFYCQLEALFHFCYVSRVVSKNLADKKKAVKRMRLSKPREWLTLWKSSFGIFVVWNQNNM